MCCAKAGIAAQLCCWIYGLPLVTGHSDDDKQINDTQILRQQQEFGDMDSCVANLTKQTKTLWDLQYCERHAWRLCGLAMNELLIESRCLGLSKEVVMISSGTQI
mmetsp:Transcript_12051/g.17302  ORF Transcript_12051/g.17302 Transcript_12051/m.17302 type:complete len:105 (+) Transcript_12051:610-924(+)